MIKNLEKVFRYGKMALYMKGFGLKIWLMVKEDCIMQMEIFMMEYNIVKLFRIGRIINLKVMVFIFIQMEQDMKEIGIMIYKMDME